MTSKGLLEESHADEREQKAARTYRTWGWAAAVLGAAAIAIGVVVSEPVLIILGILTAFLGIVIRVTQG